jgi:iron(III) transport system permease protein
MTNITSRMWRPSIVGTALILSVPILTIVFSVFEPPGENWQHLKDTVLPEYLGNSLLLTFGVGSGTLLIGVSTAWLTAMCRFPGKNLFVWLLLLPMAMPAYIVAYTYTGMFDFAGPVQTTIRDWTGWRYQEYYFPQIRSMGGAIAMLSLVLYPYVYLLGRSTFLEQSVGVMEVSRTLDCGPWTVFYRVALPLARPAIVAGLSLALMETLADYGTVAYFGLGVFTTGIFRTWFGLGDYTSAAKMAALLLLFVFVLIVMERVSRNKAQYHNSSGKLTRFSEYRLQGFKAWGAFAICAIPIFLGFFLPAAQLSLWAMETWSEMVDDRFFELIRNSFLLGLGAALISVILALFLGYGKRILPGKTTIVSIRTASIGYAIPGTVIAVGVIIPFAWLDVRIDAFMKSSFGISSGLFFSGTIVAVMFAYVVRFLAISLQTVESGLDKIKPSMDDAARSLGYRPRETLFKIHIPLMKSSTLTALMIVFVDVMKELPATLILRPFDFNTLAVRAFELASDERLADSSTAALTIVIVGLLPVIFLSKTISQSRFDQGNTEI